MALIRCTLPAVVPRPIRPFTLLFIPTFADCPSPLLHPMIAFCSPLPLPSSHCSSILPGLSVSVYRRSCGTRRIHARVCLCVRKPPFCERINPGVIVPRSLSRPTSSQRVVEITIQCFSRETAIATPLVDLASPGVT